MATSLTFESAQSAWTAAPVPRSPQPIRPTRRRSLPAACTLGATAVVAAIAVDLKNSRREVEQGTMTDPHSHFFIGILDNVPWSYSPSGRSTHSFRVNRERGDESTGRNGNNRTRASVSIGA